MERNTALPSILMLKLSIRHRICIDCFLFRRKTLNGVVMEFSVNWLFCTDGWWCLNVPLLKRGLSYHSLHECGSQIPDSQQLSFPAAGVEGRRGKGKDDENRWYSPVCLGQQCQGRLSNTFKITTGLHRHCSSTPRVVTIQTQTCFISLLKIMWL